MKLEMAKMAWRNLWRNRRRTAITLSAIVFGVFLAILFTAMQDRSFADMIDLSARLGGGHVVIQHEEFIDTPTLTRTVENTDELKAAALANPLVYKAVDRISGQAMLNSSSNNAGVFFVAYDPAVEDDTTMSFLGGVVDGALHETAKDKGVVLGQKLAHNLGVELGEKVVFTMMDRDGEIVSGLSRVTGIVSTGAPSTDGSLCLLPIDRVRDSVGYAPDEATQVAVFINDQRRSVQVADELTPSLPEGADALTWDEIAPELRGFIAMKVGGARFMELIIMLLVAASIFNTLFVSVMERMREFGIMMAIGYSRSQIFALVMWESFWLALVGLIGASAFTYGPYSYLAANGIDISAQLADGGQIDIAGVGMSPILNVGIFPENVLIIAIFAVVATMASGLYPAWRAGRVEPADTIRLV